jgi:flagellin
MLQRMRELAVQSQNTAAITETDKRKMNDEFQQLQTEIKRQVDDSTYNEKSILKGGMSHAVFQVGWFNSTTAQISVHVQSLTTASGIASIYARSLSIGSMQTSANIKTMVSTIDTALKTLDSDRSVLGAAQNRFISTINNLQSSVTNMSSAKSRIMDADFAAETATLSRAQILSQSATAMLAQANQNPQQVLSLLK